MFSSRTAWMLAGLLMLAPIRALPAAGADPEPAAAPAAEPTLPSLAQCLAVLRSVAVAPTDDQAAEWVKLQGLGLNRALLDSLDTPRWQADALVTPVGDLMLYPEQRAELTKLLSNHVARFARTEPGKPNPRALRDLQALVLRSLIMDAGSRTYHWSELAIRYLDREAKSRLRKHESYKQSYRSMGTFDRATGAGQRFTAEMQRNVDELTELLAFLETGAAANAALGQALGDLKDRAVLKEMAKLQAWVTDLFATYNLEQPAETTTP